MNPVLTIVGASVRAAAYSAVRAGYRIRAADLFADADLRAACEVTRAGNYPSGLSAAVRGPQPGAWMYTGGLENHPSLVEAMSRSRTLWGNSSVVLRRVRNPRLVAEVFGRRGLPHPAVAFAPHAVPRDGSWLLKRRRSAGGAGVGFWNEDAPPPDQPAGCYFQRFVDGRACSAVYVAAEGDAVLLGITRQLVAEAWTGAGGFRYCGSVGPIELPAAAKESFAAIGAVLARDFDLVGLFGVDAVVNARGVWPVEVNPRYTGSVEILERASGLLAIERHAAACRQGELLPYPTPMSSTTSGKAILFARSRLQIPRAWTERAMSTQDPSRPMLADIPSAGSTIETGWPIATIFADAADEGGVCRKLREKAADVLASLSLWGD